MESPLRNFDLPKDRLLPSSESRGSQFRLLSRRRTVGRMTMKSTHRILGHSLLCSLVRLLRTACYARAVRCAHSFARSLTHSLRSSWERGFCPLNECFDFIQFQTTVRSAALWVKTRANPCIKFVHGDVTASFP